LGTFNFGKPDPHQNGKEDPNPHHSEKQGPDPEPHQSEKVEALEGHFGEFDGRIRIRIRI
jgi:hypothetical protein